MPDRRFDATPKRKGTTRVHQHLRMQNGKTILVKEHTRTFLKARYGAKKERDIYNLLSDLGANEVIAADVTPNIEADSCRILTDAKDEVYYFGSEASAKKFAEGLVMEYLWDLGGEGINANTLEAVGATYGQKQDFEYGDLRQDDAFEISKLIVEHYGYEKVFEDSGEIFSGSLPSEKTKLFKDDSGAIMWW